MNGVERLLASLAGWIDEDEDVLGALLKLFKFARARDLPRLLPHIVEAAYLNPFCFVITVRNVPKATIFGADKVQLDNFILEKEMGKEGSEMAGDLQQIRGTASESDTDEDDERLEVIIKSEYVKVIELDEAVRRAPEIVEELARDDSHFYLVIVDGKPRAGIFQFHEDDLENFIFGWHPAWIAEDAAWCEEIAANERGEMRTFFAVDQWLVRLMCADIAGGDEDERNKAFESLKEMGKVHGLLIEALRDDEASVRSGAARALGELGIEKAIPDIVEMIANSEEDDYEGRTRISGFWALVNLGQAGVGPLTEMLASPDEDIRGKAVWALGKIGDRRAAHPLIDMLGDEESFVRRDAVMALGRIKESTAVVPLIGRLNDEAAEVRWAAAISLKKLGDRKALEHLERLLDDEDEKVREGAREAIDGLGTLPNDGP